MGRGSAVVTRTGFCAEPGEVPAGTPSRIYTPGALVFNTQNMPWSFLQDQVLTIKVAGSQGGLLSHIQGIDEVTGHWQDYTLALQATTKVNM